jgi:hypothetical protein
VTEMLPFEAKYFYLLGLVDILQVFFSLAAAVSDVRDMGWRFFCIRMCPSPLVIPAIHVDNSRFESDRVLYRTQICEDVKKGLLDLIRSGEGRCV